MLFGFMIAINCSGILNYKFVMPYKKWLNLVIFLISAMIILLLIVQKSMNTQKVHQFQQSIPLIPQSFILKNLKIAHQQLSPVAIQDLLPSNSGSDPFNNWITSWKTETAVAVISFNGTVPSESLKIEWQSEHQTLVFYRLINDEVPYQILDISQQKILQFSKPQWQQLFPEWFQKLADHSARE